MPAGSGNPSVRASTRRPTPEEPAAGDRPVDGEARAVARNIFLDGNSWKASHSVDKRPVVGDLNDFEFEEPLRIVEGRATYVDGNDADTNREFADGGVGTCTLAYCAVSGDGRWVMAANYLPHTLALFDADLKLQRVYDAATLDGKASSRVSAVYDAQPRRSFVVALKDIPELWEISYDPKAEPIHDGLVHQRYFKWVPRRGYAKRLVQAHKLHHATIGKEGGVSFGFVIARDPAVLKQELKAQREAGIAVVREALG